MAAFLNLLVVLVLLGVFLGLVNRFLPLPTAIKGLFNTFVSILWVLYILQFFGVVNISVLPKIVIFY